jgi:hypothetical protein
MQGEAGKAREEGEAQIYICITDYDKAAACMWLENPLGLHDTPLH